jgi:ribosomal protein S18 acetylase RimI-like enzyme
MRLRKRISFIKDYCNMRIRRYRQEDLPSLVHIHRAAAQADGTEMMSDAEFEEWFMDSEVDVLSNAVVITDDDDELNTCGQAGTLDGLQGEIVGYTVVQLRQDTDAHHLLCQGAVHPDYRRHNAGRALMMAALNRAHTLAAELEFEAEDAGHRVYFEALLPVRDPASSRLAAKCEMEPTDERAPAGLRLYRREL